MKENTLHCPHCGGVVFRKTGLERGGKLLKIMAQKILDAPPETVWRPCDLHGSGTMKQTYNAIHYLLRHGSLKKIGYGKFIRHPRIGANDK